MMHMHMHIWPEPVAAACPHLQEVSAMLADLSTMAQRVCDAITAHMLHEEAEVIPLLEAHLGAEQQRKVRGQGSRTNRLLAHCKLCWCWHWG